MVLPLVALLIMTPPAATPHAWPTHIVTAEGAPITPGESSAEQRIRWARGRIDDELGRLWSSQGYPLGVVRAVEWVESLPLKVDVQGGCLTLALRLRGP